MRFDEAFAILVEHCASVARTLGSAVRLGSNAGYAEGSPSIWCCRDHSAGMSARRATPMS
jgi:hypothetical protein